MAVDFAEFVDPNPRNTNGFGSQVVALPSGNVVISSPGDDAGGLDAGAMYLFDGSDGSLISTLLGSGRDDLKFARIVTLKNGNFAIVAPEADVAGKVNAGAVLVGDAETGIAGTISPSNALVGATAFDSFGRDAITLLENGNLVVSSEFVDYGGVVNAGVIALVDGSGASVGELSSSNALFGQSASDFREVTVTVLANDNFVIQTPRFDSANFTDAGAITHADGAAGLTGVINSSNSVIGKKGGAFFSVEITPLTNGNYVIANQFADFGAMTFVGATTWVDGTVGFTGTFDTSNTLYGASSNGFAGLKVTPLSDGDYVVSMPFTTIDGKLQAGAVHLADGTVGSAGVISSANSLVGGAAFDQVGWAQVGEGVTVLSNGNYVVTSYQADINGVSNAGAVTLIDPTSPVTGSISAANSLVGATEEDRVGAGGVVALTNGNYVVSSGSADINGVMQAGAVTFGNGVTGVTGPVSAVNSLHGTRFAEQVGERGLGTLPVFALPNGNFVVVSPRLGLTEGDSVGAVTIVDGSVGLSGAVDGNNSFMGRTAGDFRFPYSTLLSGNRFAINARFSASLTEADVGSVTVFEGQPGFTGTFSESTSLLGVGQAFVTELANGNIVVGSPAFDVNGAINAGAVTLVDATTGTQGVVDSTRSLVGTTSNDGVGREIIPLSSGNFLSVNPQFDANGLSQAGAVTLIDGTNGLTGEINAANSTLGEASNARVRAIVDDVNGTYYVAGFPNVVKVFSQEIPEPDGQIDASGNLVFQGDDGADDNITIRTEGTNYRVSDASRSLTGGPGTTVDGDDLLIPIAQITGGVIVNGGDGDDALTIDLSSGTTGFSDVIFNGGFQTTAVGDSLTVIGSFGTQTVTLTPPGPDGDNGTITVESVTITFTGLEPIQIGNSIDSVISLPSLLSNTASLQSGTGGTLELIDLGATFEDTFFPLPSNSFVLNGGDESDEIQIQASLAGVSSAINTGGGDDRISIENLDFGTIAAGQGDDTLVLNAAGLTLDLTMLDDSRLGGIERIDLTAAGAQTVRLDPSEVIALSDSSDTLMIERDPGDIVDLGATWTLDGVVDESGVLFQRYVQGAATLLLEVVEVDFGDAPLTFAQDAGHVGSGPRLGDHRDYESAAAPSAAVDGDDTNGVDDDEDGVMLGSLRINSTMSAVNLDLQNAANAKADAWIDFDFNGEFSAQEKILDDAMLIAGLQTLNFAVPEGLTPGSTVLRVRVSSQGGLSPGGLAADGEIEDHAVVIDDAVTPIVESVVINAGQSQRSRVTELQVTFNTEVVVPLAAFQIDDRGTGQPVNLTVNSQVIDGKTVSTLAFLTGPGVVDSVIGPNSLADGNFELTVAAALVTAGNQAMAVDHSYGSDASDMFFRYFGDSDGDRDVDGQDYGRFGLTFLKSSGESGFDASFDFDADGDVDGQDYGQFGLRFLTQLPF